MRSLRVVSVAAALLAAGGAFAATAPIEAPLGPEQPPAEEPAAKESGGKGPGPATNYIVPAEYQVCINPQYDDVIDETQTNNWRYQVRRRDEQLMARIAGTWRAQEPNGVGGVTHVQSTTHPEGSFTFEKRTCVSMPGLGTSCPTSIGHGYWAAHWGENGTIFMATLVSFSGFTGEVVRGVCGGAYLRLLDEDTSQNIHTGGIAHRVR